MDWSTNAHSFFRPQADPVYLFVNEKQKCNLLFRAEDWDFLAVLVSSGVRFFKEESDPTNKLLLVTINLIDFFILRRLEVISVRPS